VANEPPDENNPTLGQTHSVSPGMTSEIINGVAQRARGIRYIPQKFGGSQSQTVGIFFTERVRVRRYRHVVCVSGG